MHDVAQAVIGTKPGQVMARLACAVGEGIFEGDMGRCPRVLKDEVRAEDGCEG